MLKERWTIENTGSGKVFVVYGFEIDLGEHVRRVFEFEPKAKPWDEWIIRKGGFFDTASNQIVGNADGCTLQDQWDDEPHVMPPVPVPSSIVRRVFENASSP